jgi:hypothetical protein
MKDVMWGYAADGSIVAGVKGTERKVFRVD